jgi:hypothetical protein
LSGTTRIGGLCPYAWRGSRARGLPGARLGVHEQPLSLLLETPEAKLARGMGWLQKADTKRIKTRHRLWGHLSGGRYKAILVEAGNCFWALLDYIHLNLWERDWSTTARGWKPLAATALEPISGWPSRRPQWLETDMGFAVVGCKDSAAGRREFLSLLEKRSGLEEALACRLVVSSG